MNYEKKYKEALERAKQFSEKPYLEDSKGIVEYIFPELQESEDERIRKSLIDMLKNDEKCYLKEIAWLEKQGEIDKISYEIAEKEKREFVGDGFIKCYADFQDFKEMETYWLEYVGNDNYNVRSDNLLGKTYHITPCQLYTIFKKQTWLEKKCEQKPAVIIPKFRVGDEIKTSNEESLTITKIDEKGYWSEDLFICGFDDADNWKLVEQKPAEWSEEDEQYLLVCKNALAKYQVSDKWDATIISRWLEDKLKSIKPQSTWKPSEEQIMALRWVLNHIPYNSHKEEINGLLEELLKLYSYGENR